MIVWLASYPRSGNTLLRTVLKQTMGLDSYSDEKIRPILRLTATAKQAFGHLPIEEPWDAFYARASADDATHLVKTHLPPRDQQPVIYVVRDGRRATESYRAYHSSFQPDPNLRPGHVDLMLGNDFYGSWSSHYRAWASRPGGAYLLVRYEQLVAADKPLLEELAGFIEWEGEICPFVNRMDTMHRENPDFFRTGEVKWRRPAHWMAEEDALFLDLHGDVLLKLGYIQESALSAARQGLDELLIRTARAACRAFEERNAWHHEASKKEQVISQLVSQLKRETEPPSDTRSVLEKLLPWGR